MSRRCGDPGNGQALLYVHTHTSAHLADVERLSQGMQSPLFGSIHHPASRTDPCRYMYVGPAYYARSDSLTGLPNLGGPVYALAPQWSRSGAGRSPIAAQPEGLEMIGCRHILSCGGCASLPDPVQGEPRRRDFQYLGPYTPHIVSSRRAIARRTFSQTQHQPLSRSKATKQPTAWDQPANRLGPRNSRAEYP